MIVFINWFLELLFGIIIVRNIINYNLNNIIIFGILLIIIIFNNIAIISKNKYIYSLEENYYYIINKMSCYLKNNNYDKMNEYLKNARQTTLFNTVRNDHSDNPNIDKIRDMYDDEQ